MSSTTSTPVFTLLDLEDGGCAGVFATEKEADDYATSLWGVQPSEEQYNYDIEKVMYIQKQVSNPRVYRYIVHWTPYPDEDNDKMIDFSDILAVCDTKEQAEEIRLAQAAKDFKDEYANPECTVEKMLRFYPIKRVEANKRIRFEEQNE